MERDPAFSDLERAYTSGELILYAGAGVAAAAGVPTARRLMDLLTERLRARKADATTLQDMERLLQAGRWFDMLTVAREFLGNAEFAAFIQRSFDDRHLPVPEVARAIADLAPNLHAVLTTNLDSVIERAFEGRWPVIDRRTPDIEGRSKFILKLHGTVMDPSTWVLGKEDYPRAIYMEPSLKPMLRELLWGRPMLFVGSAVVVDEPPLQTLLELVKGDGASRFALWETRDLTPFARKNLGSFGIQLIGYENPDGRHGGVVDLLRVLREAGPPPGEVQRERPLRPSAQANVKHSQQVPEFSQTKLPDNTVPAKPTSGSSIEVPPFRFSLGLSRVLDAALQIRAQRKEQGAALSSSTVLFALVEAGRHQLQEGEPASTRWLSSRIKLDSYESTLAGYLAGPFSFTQRSPEEVRSELANVSRTPNILTLFNTAASLAKRASGAGVISTRHVLGALLAERKAPRVSNALLRLAEVTALDLAQLRTDFLAYVTTGHPSDNAPAWRETLLGRQPTPPAELLPPGYSTDDADGKDLLDLRDEIAGFASFIASVTLIPPLSIGLFGSWGSGKSFFMKKLRAEIDTIAVRAAQSPSEEGKRFCSAIVPIEFNAWHYAEANLWASLVDHIFQSLSDHLLDKAKAGKKQVEGLFEQLETSKQLRDEAKGELEKAKTEQTTAESALAKRVEEQQQRASNLKGLLSWDFWKNVTLDVLSDQEKKQVHQAAERLGLPVIERSARELKAVVDESKTVTGRMKLMASSLLLRPWSYWVLLGFALGLPVLVGIAYELTNTDTVRSVTAVFGAVSVWLGSGTAWLKRQMDQAKSVLDALGGADAKITARLAQEESKHRGNLELAERELEQAKITVSMAERRLAQAEERVRAAQINLEESRPERRIARFIQERVGSDDYRKHLGVVATVRRDFQRLSALMYPEESTAANVLLSTLPPLPRVDRIVLYIDDLDRCPPARVVEVLEAVHLLLAFKLFVVVVGVDSRWMRRSLLERYPGLLMDDHGMDRKGEDPVVADASAGSHDYLEKIFQIPFWVRPMDASGAFRLITGLLTPVKEPPPAASSDSGAQAASGGNVTVEEPESNVKDVGAEPAAAQPKEREGALTATKNTSMPTSPEEDVLKGATPTSPRGVVESAAQRLDIHHLEIEFMEGLTPYIGRSPRRVKRFVNIYRLFKASLPTEARSTFIKKANKSGDHQPVLVLLAILTGAPRFAPQLLRQLLTMPLETTVRALMEGLKDASDTERCNTLGALGVYVQAEGEDVTIQELATWAAQVGRYSFAVASPNLSVT